MREIRTYGLKRGRWPVRLARRAGVYSTVSPVEGDGGTTPQGRARRLRGSLSAHPRSRLRPSLMRSMGKAYQRPRSARIPQPGFQGGRQ